MSYGNASTATPPINVRLDPAQLAALDELAKTLPGYKPSRSDAIREAIRRGLDSIAKDGGKEKFRTATQGDWAGRPHVDHARATAPRHLADTLDDPPAMGAKPRKLASPALVKTLAKAKKKAAKTTTKRTAKKGKAGK